MNDIAGQETGQMRTAIFGHGAPLGVMAALGITAEDISLAAADPCAEADQFLEEFIDPFVRSVLRRLVAGQLDIYDQIIFFRDSPGAVHAFHYACEYERRGLLSDPPHFNWSSVMDSECGGLSMTNKRPKPEEIVSKLRQVEVLMGQGMSRLDAIRQIGVVEQTYYRWRKQYGGMGVDQLKELKRLQKENDRLRRAVSDLTLDKLILKEAARGNF
jgi:putative transposase